MHPFSSAAQSVIDRCRVLAGYTEEPGFTTRRFLTRPMLDVHRDLREWMTATGMTVEVDGAGNLRGSFRAKTTDAPTLYIGSHLDTVPRAGAFDGILGVLLGVALIELLQKERLGFAIEVIGFSEEEGIRFGVPFIGSRAVVGCIDDALLLRTDAEGTTVADAIRAFGLDPADLPHAVAEGRSCGYLEFHIEQGPVLESLDIPLGVVEAIAGQSRVDVTFTGLAGHAGTTPMLLRRDALAGAAEWIHAVEREALSICGLVATVGRIEAQPGATNVIPGRVQCSLDVRHAEDSARMAAVNRLLAVAREIASRRRLNLQTEIRLEQCSVRMDARLTDLLACAAGSAHRMNSGAGHDAMIMARRMPAAMLFLRSPGGLSHHPDESVLTEDVASALEAGMNFLRILETVA